MMMYVSPEAFDGYPYPQMTKAPVIGLNVPHPAGMWLTDPAVFGGYPHRLVNYANLFFAGVNLLRMGGVTPTALACGDVPCTAAYYGGSLVYLRG